MYVCVCCVTLSLRYLETFKAYENKGPESIRERIDDDYASRCVACDKLARDCVPLSAGVHTHARTHTQSHTHTITHTITQTHTITHTRRERERDRERVRERERERERERRGEGLDSVPTAPALLFAGADPSSPCPSPDTFARPVRLRSDHHPKAHVHPAP